MSHGKAANSSSSSLDSSSMIKKLGPGKIGLDSSGMIKKALPWLASAVRVD